MRLEFRWLGTDPPRCKIFLNNKVDTVFLVKNMLTGRKQQFASNFLFLTKREFLFKLSS